MESGILMRTVPAILGLWLVAAFSQPVHAEGPFSWEGGFGSVNFKVDAVRQGDNSVVTITPSGLSVTKEPVVREMKGVVERAEVADLNADQNLELYVYAKSANGNPTTSVIGLSVNNGKSLSDIYFPPLAEDSKNSKGFSGNDDMAAVESAFVHRFPVQGTSKTRQLQFKLKQGEAGWIMVLDKVVEY
jgi:hypothetical protein